MSAGDAPLAELLAALAPPLEYLAANEFQGAVRTRLPLDALVQRLARARADAAPELHAALEELGGVLDALRSAAPADRAPLLRRAHALLPALRGAATTWNEYRRGTGAMQPMLDALAQPVAALRAVGPKRAAELARFGLATVEDVLWHLPFRYEDWRTRVPLSG